jgi:SRSO17 transposase
MSRTRPATPTVAFIDQYCAQYRSLFSNVRHFEHFTALHLGLLAETRHKSLPRLGKTVHADPQALHQAIRHQAEAASFDPQRSQARIAALYQRYPTSEVPAAHAQHRCQIGRAPK